MLIDGVVVLESEDNLGAWVCILEKEIEVDIVPRHDEYVGIDDLLLKVQLVVHKLSGGIQVNMEYDFGTDTEWWNATKEYLESNGWTELVEE